MKRLIITLIAILVSIVAIGQKVKFVENRLDADITIYVTKNRLEADLVIYKTTKTADRKKGVWVEVSNRLDADYLIYKTAYRKEADYVVYYTTNINEVKSKL